MVNYMIPGTIDPRDQGHANLCWLASTTMLYEWKENQSFAMDTIAARLGEPFTSRAVSGPDQDYISFGEVELLKSQAGFAMVGQQCLSATGWERLLRSYGPLFVIADFDNGAGVHLAHAVVVTGIVGDESADNTTIYFIDPNGASSTNTTLGAFSAIFEYGAGTDAPFQVMHWP
jgi:hypothetical protein